MNPLKRNVERRDAKERRCVKERAPRSSAAGQEKEIALLIRERDEALSRQTATADILRVISQSPTDLRPVFDSIVFTAVRLLRCDLVFMLLCDGATFSPAAVASLEGRSRTSGPRICQSIPVPIFPHARSSTKKCCICRTGRTSICPNTN